LAEYAHNKRAELPRHHSARLILPGASANDDLVEHDFTAEAPDEKWLTNLTEHPTSEGKLDLRTIEDCASNRIVSYSMRSRMTLSSGFVRSRGNGWPSSTFKAARRSFGTGRIPRLSRGGAARAA